jgi:Big-like domain-containing protein
MELVRLNRKKSFVKIGLVATALALAGISSAWAAGEVIVTAATGGEAIPATASGAWTTLTGPIISESDAGAIKGGGTLVLVVPAGFEFNTDAPVSVLVEGGIGPHNIDGVANGGTIPVTVTPTSLSIDLFSRSSANANANTLTFQNIQVRPTAVSPLVSGNLTESGTCGLGTLILPTGTWGLLREVGGPLVESLVALSSSQNPIVEGSPVGFTATLSALAPALSTATPTGGVQFLVNGVPSGGPVALNAGSATLNTTQLSAGSNIVSAVYLGDANFASSSSTLIEVVQMDISTVTILKISGNANGTATLLCQGVPGALHLVQATGNLWPPVVWQNVSTNVAGFIDGTWTCVQGISDPPRFFRALKP